MEKKFHGPWNKFAGPAFSRARNGACDPFYRYGVWGARMEMKNRKRAEPRPPMQSQSPPTQAEPSLGRDIRTKIGQQLRAMYDDVVSQGVPDRFHDLLKQLDKQNKK